MRVFKLRHFDRWLKKQRIPNKTLENAVKEIEVGLFEAYLGGFLYKKRIPVPGKGKKGGARTILAYKAQETIIFLFGFSKNQKETITHREQVALQELANFYMKTSELVLNKAIELGELLEVKENG